MMKTTLEVKRRTRAGMKSEVSFQKIMRGACTGLASKIRKSIVNIFLKKPFLQNIACGTAQKL